MVNIFSLHSGLLTQFPWQVENTLLRAQIKKPAQSLTKEYARVHPCGEEGKEEQMPFLCLMWEDGGTGPGSHLVAQGQISEGDFQMPDSQY